MSDLARPTIAGSTPLPGRGVGGGSWAQGRWRLDNAIVLALADVFAVSLAVFPVHWLASAQNGQDSVLAEGFRNAIVLVIALHACLGLYRPVGKRAFERFRSRVLGACLLIVVNGIILSRHGVVPAFAFSVFTGLLTLVFGFWLELLFRAKFTERPKELRALIFGSGQQSRSLCALLSERSELGLRPVGLIEGELSNAARSGTYDQEGSAIPRFGCFDEIATRADLDVVVVPKWRQQSADTVAFERFAAGAGLVKRDIPSASCPDGQTDLESLCEVFGPPGRFARSSYYLVKRSLDISLALPLLILASPILLLAALAIKTIDRGPALYRQVRVGYEGKAIHVLKLRTMFRDAEFRLQSLLESDPAAREQWTTFFKLVKDPRILPIVGNVLRRTSLDELPQLWNVVRGDMSLVGPRPFPSYHVEAFEADFQQLRKSVPPGLTGLWQISSRSDGDLVTQQAQDTHYILGRSLLFDFYILLATPAAVIGGQGAR